jgi:hypothetical protein
LDFFSQGHGRLTLEARSVTIHFMKILTFTAGILFLAVSNRLSWRSTATPSSSPSCPSMISPQPSRSPTGFDKLRPDVLAGSSRSGAVAMNIDSGNARLVLLCPAWKRNESATFLWLPGVASIRKHCRKQYRVMANSTHFG